MSEDRWVESMKALIDEAALQSETKGEFMETVTVILNECRRLGKGFEEVEAYALKRLDGWELGSGVSHAAYRVVGGRPGG